MRTAPLLVAAFASGLLPGCAALRKADTPVTMRLSPVFAPRSDQSPRTVAVASVQARGLTGALRYAYVTSDAPSTPDVDILWEEPPPRVLERALVAGLRTRSYRLAGRRWGWPPTAAWWPR